MGEILELPVPRSAPRMPLPGEEMFAQAVSSASRLYRNGIAITPDTMMGELPDLGIERLTIICDSPLFAKALEDRGIDFDPQTRLSAHQLAALSIYMDTSSKMTHPQRLKAAGVTQRIWDGWMRSPRFAGFLTEMSEDRLRDLVPLAHLRLGEAVDRAEAWAIRYVNEITGRYNPAQQYDLRAILMSVAAILDEEKVPVEVMDKIGARMSEVLSNAPKQPATARMLSD